MKEKNCFEWRKNSSSQTTVPFRMIKFNSANKKTIKTFIFVLIKQDNDLDFFN